MSRPKVASHVVSHRESRARVIARLYFALGQSYPFLKILSQVQLGPWLFNRRPVKMGFLQSLTGRWSCRPRALWGGLLPTFFSGFRASSSGCTWSSYSLPWPAHWPEVVRSMRKLSWFGNSHRSLRTHRSWTVYHYQIWWCEGLHIGRRYFCRRTLWSLRV